MPQAGALGVAVQDSCPDTVDPSAIDWVTVAAVTELETVALTCELIVVPLLRNASTRKTCVPFESVPVSSRPPMLSP